jgi:hypothetical protein
MAMRNTAMTTANECNQHAREARLRRSAERQGLRLVKSRSRTPSDVGYGCYRLLDAVTSGPIAADLHPAGMSLDQVDAALAEAVA